MAGHHHGNACIDAVAYDSAQCAAVPVLSVALNLHPHAHWTNEPQKMARLLAMRLIKLRCIDLRKPYPYRFLLVRAAQLQAIAVVY